MTSLVARPLPAPIAAGVLANKSIAFEEILVNPLCNWFQVFILLDKPDDELDALMSDHVMRLHASKRRKTDRQGILTCTSNPLTSGQPPHACANHMLCCRRDVIAELESSE